MLPKLGSSKVPHSRLGFMVLNAEPVPLLLTSSSPGDLMSPALPSASDVDLGMPNASHNRRPNQIKTCSR